MHEIEVGFFCCCCSFQYLPGVTCLYQLGIFISFSFKGIYFVKAKRFDCMSSSKSCFQLLKSHDKRSLLIEVEFFESVIHNRNSGNLLRKIKISSKIYEIEKGKMSLFFINQATYLEDSRPFVPLSDVEFGTFPAFQETKAVTNSELDAE